MWLSGRAFPQRAGSPAAYITQQTHTQSKWKKEVWCYSVSMEGSPDRRLGEGHVEHFLEDELHIHEGSGAVLLWGPQGLE